MEKVKITSICPVCEIVMSTRTNHCSICEKCVERYDHHCPWINNCVGIGNHNIFMGLIAFLLLYFFFGLNVSITALVTFIRYPLENFDNSLKYCFELLQCEDSYACAFIGGFCTLGLAFVQFVGLGLVMYIIIFTLIEP